MPRRRTWVKPSSAISAARALNLEMFASCWSTMSSQPSHFSSPELVQIDGSLFQSLRVLPAASQAFWASRTAESRSRGRLWVKPSISAAVWVLLALILLDSLDLVQTADMAGLAAELGFQEGLGG